MKISIIRALCLLAGLAVSTAGTAAAPAADTYPSRPIRLIVPFTPGGGTDISARLIAQRLSAALGQQVVAENRAGANGKIGSAFVARAEPDGYTLLLGTVSTHATDPELYGSQAPYNPVKDFTPVFLVSELPMVMSTYSDAPVRTMPEFIKWIKDNPGKYNFASSGLGGIGHLTIEQLMREAGMQMTHIPYKGAADALTNLVAQRVQLFDDVVPSSLPSIKAGKLRALAVPMKTRSEYLPDVPTMAELGYPNAVATVWTAIFAPAGTPREILEKLNTVGNKELKSAETRKLFAGSQIMPLGDQGVDSARQYVQSESQKWSALVRTLGLVK